MKKKWKAQSKPMLRELPSKCFSLRYKRTFRHLSR